MRVNAEGAVAFEQYDSASSEWVSKWSLSG